jgi:hypothetical protein
MPIVIATLVIGVAAVVITVLLGVALVAALLVVGPIILGALAILAAHKMMTRTTNDAAAWQRYQDQKHADGDMRQMRRDQLAHDRTIEIIKTSFAAAAYFQQHADRRHGGAPMTIDQIARQLEKPKKH